MDLTSMTTISVGVGARDLALGGADLVARASGACTPEELLRETRALRRAAVVVQDRAVLAARARGCTWEAIAACIEMPVRVVRARYEKVYDQWAIAHLDPEPHTARAGTANDPDPRETALDLDVWCLGQGARSNYSALAV